MSKIMIVDDELEIAEMIEDFLKIENIDVVKVDSGEEALRQFDASIELVILDINLNGINGIEVCKQIRKNSYVPIVFLTCNNTQNDKLLGLGLGADDYITKPFNPVELVARVKANIRRAQSYSSNRISDEIITFGDVAIYKRRYKVTINRKDTEITSIEFKLLIYLIENAHIAQNRNQILTNVWGNTFYDLNLVNTTIKRLRKRIENDPENPRYIKTVWGVGYVFEGTVR